MSAMDANRAFGYVCDDYLSPGLSKREHYAGQAMQGLISAGEGQNAPAEIVAEACWEAGIERAVLQFVRTPDNEVGQALVVGADAVILDLEDAVGKRLVFKAEPSYPTDAVHYRFLTGDGQQAKVHIPPGLGIKP